MKKIRLDRLLGNLGYGSRKEVQELVRKKQVQLDGNLLLDFSAHIALDSDLPNRLTVENEPLDPLPGMFLLMNKPLGTTCSHKEEGDLVYEWLSRS